MTSKESSSSAIGRPRLFGEWCGIMVSGTLVFTIANLAFFVASYVPEPDVVWNPWGDLGGMLVLSSIGWAIMGMIGPLWFAPGGLAGVLKTRKRQFHVFTLIATILFGSLWPKTFWAWMSV